MKCAIIGGFSLSILCNVYLFYVLFDTGVSLDHARAQVGSLAKRSDVALSILRSTWIGRHQTEIVKMGESLAQGSVVVKNEGKGFLVGDVRFEFSGGVVSDVSYYSEP